VLVEKLDRVVMRDGARHEIQRHRAAVALGGAADLFDVDLDERRLRDRADGEQALGFVEAEAAALPAGSEQDADLAGAEGFDATLAGLGWGEP
jgi:hypothetical protein